MIIPENLAPLPVSPRGDDPAGSAHGVMEDFVTAGDVRKVLLGTAGELPVEGLSADDFDSFAGRADVPYPSRSSPSADRSVELRVPDLALEPQVIHPAFEVLPPTTRRAAPPRAAAAVDREATFGRKRMTDRWWVIGMGVAASAILFSGTFVDFISREAVRRSRASAPLDVIHVIPGKSPRILEEPSDAAFAAKVRPDEVE